MMNGAIIEVTIEMLATMLDLPPGATITRIKIDYSDTALAIIVHHPDLPEVQSGEFYPTVAPIYVAVPGSARLAFESWGKPEWIYPRGE